MWESPQYPACSLRTFSEQMGSGVASSSFLMDCLLAWVSSASDHKPKCPQRPSHWQLDVCLLNILDYCSSTKRYTCVSWSLVFLLEEWVVLKLCCCRQTAETVGKYDRTSGLSLAWEWGSDREWCWPWTARWFTFTLKKRTAALSSNLSECDESLLSVSSLWR